MDKNEILEKSRQENKNRDLVEQEVLAKSFSGSCIAAAVLATIFFLVQICVGKGVNYGFYAVVFSMSMGSFWVKFAMLKKKHELFMAILYTVFVLMLAAAYIYKLVTEPSAL